jgi:DNA modification methylase
MDPFGGSGTALLLQLKTNRKLFYIDKSMEYCKLAEKFISQEKSKLF